MASLTIPHGCSKATSQHVRKEQDTRDTDFHLEAGASVLQMFSVFCVIFRCDQCDWSIWGALGGF